MQITKQKLWTYEDYYNLDDEKRYEVIEGELIEILSSSNPECDKIKKFKLYEKFKVKELWIIDPDEKSIKIYTLEADC